MITPLVSKEVLLLEYISKNTKGLQDKNSLRIVTRPKIYERSIHLLIKLII